MSTTTPRHTPEVLSFGAITVEDDFGGRGGRWQIDDALCNRTYTNRLKIEVSSQLVGPVQILKSLGVQIGDTYRFPMFSASPTETDTGSFVNNITVEWESGGPSGATWIATIDYVPFDIPYMLGTQFISDGTIDPTFRRPEVYFSEAKYKRTRPEDRTTDPKPKPFINTVGDPLLDTPETEETRQVLKYVRWERSYNDTYASSFKDTVNKDAFLGFPPNTVKCKDINGEANYDADWGWYFKITYEFEFRIDPDEKGYTERLLNMGYREKVNGTGSPVQIQIQGKDISDAVCLKQDGSYDPNADPYFIEFQLFKAVNFADLNIPEDLLNPELS